MSGGTEESARVLAEMARGLAEADSVEQTLEGITALAVREIDGAEYAGVMLVRKGGVITTEAATAPVVEQVDAVQHRLGQGPCLSAVWVRDVFSIDDMAEERRWPKFTARVRKYGIESMLSFQLFTPNDTLGGLNLYASRPHAFDARAHEVGAVLTAHASVALAGARRASHLREGMRTRQRIGEATGILMERYGLSDQQAFLLLSKASQRYNTKLRDLADHLVRTGTLPDPPPEKQ
ncbi:GAF and ANTAR domain-containing protein [Nocardiopsis trehalosi]|jgi:transcriptional regulator with GAF, ATPase, and Fis domain|uniref:GAF and ANTAR domain-containing protein n=1 Tax=Nocardiopsis trehalosi TaxID=109329 RepID=UPI0008378E14|nr:GAF and ANTAR domain-containing protein [Nocardiopsis trehalosi]